MLLHCAGLWLLRPTRLTVRFMQALSHRLMWDAPWQWDQTAWCAWARVWAPDSALLHLRMHFGLPARLLARLPTCSPTRLHSCRNDVILSFSGWAMGDDGQLRYRLLPHSGFSNIGEQAWRQWQGCRPSLAPHCCLS